MEDLETKKKILIFGHKNPDTDSVVSSTALAFLKHKLGFTQYVACRAGQLNPQSDYIYKKFNVTPPLYISNLEPKVENYMHKGAYTVNENDSIWNAVQTMRQNKINAMPVVDGENHYKGLLNNNLVLKSIFDTLDPNHHVSIFTSAKLLKETVGGTFLSEKDIEEIKKYKIISASTSFFSFSKTMTSHLPQPLIVVTGDREDIQLLCLENKVDIMIISGSRMPSDKIIDFAKKIGTTLILSPFNTSSTAMLLMYSVPVFKIADETIEPLKKNTLLALAKKQILSSPLRMLPVVDDNNCVVGIMSEIDIHNEPDIQLALVDHNERSQAIDGLENYAISEIIDHHRIGSTPTKTPVTFINLPVGSTATIISKLFEEYNVEIPEEIAGLLLCGILSDTLGLKSATTTSLDIKFAQTLSTITGLDTKSLANEIIKAGSRIGNRSAVEIIKQDMKEYQENGKVFTVSQIEVDGTQEILKRRDEFIKELENIRSSNNALFCSLLITDISTLNSLMVISASEDFLDFLHFPKKEDNVFVLKGVVSRKKQLMPMLSEILAQFN